MMKRKGIRKKVVFTVTLLVVFSLLLLGGAVSGLIFITQKNQLMAFQEEIVKNAVNEINWDLHELEALLKLSVNNYDLRSDDDRTLFNSLSMIISNKDIKQHNILDELVLLDNQGRERARVSRTTVYADNELGDRSGESVFTVPLNTGKIFFGPITYDKQTYEPRIILSVPIINIMSGEVEGVLLGRIRLNRIWENVSSMTFGENGIVIITDAAGKVVAHPDPSVIYRNTSYKAETPKGIQTGLNGVRIMQVSDTFKLGENKFVVYAMIPFGEVIGLSMRTLSTTVLFVFVFILLSISITIVAINRIVRPIETLADTARGISAGKLDLTAQVGNADEIGDLSSAFNVMTSKLLESINSLKIQMAELKQAEDTIKNQNEFLNNVLNSMTHPFYVIDADDYTVKMANPATQFNMSSGKATCYALTHHRNEPCDGSEHPCVIKKIKETGKPVTVEHVHFNNDGKTFVNEVHGYPIFDDKGNITQVIEYNLDISERKLAEDKIKASLKEKEVLLREIHHRTKNNMQVISSLLRLQSMQMNDPMDVEMLTDSQNRIKSMSLIHEKLYLSKDLAHIDFHDYIRDLSRDIFLFYEKASSRVTVDIQADDIWLGIDTAIPCGLIINELISNSLKHAFPDGRKGEIRINLKKINDNELLLCVSDNGVGIPDGLDFRKTETLGLRLITALSEDQLRGEVELDRTHGTEFRIRFKELKYGKRI